LLDETELIDPDGEQLRAAESAGEAEQDEGAVALAEIAAATEAIRMASA
jgi:hypothetical protein